MPKFAYNNTKNASASYTPLELNFGYYPKVSFKHNIDFCFKPKLANKLLKEPWKLITICCKNIHHREEFEKQAYNKGVKPRNYVPKDKIWLNGK